MDTSEAKARERHIPCLAECHHCCVQCSRCRCCNWYCSILGRYNDFLQLIDWGLLEGTAQEYVRMYAYFLWVKLSHVYLDWIAWECLITLLWNFCSVPKNINDKRTSAFVSLWRWSLSQCFCVAHVWAHVVQQSAAFSIWQIKWTHKTWTSASVDFTTFFDC